MTSRVLRNDRGPAGLGKVGFGVIAFGLASYVTVAAAGRSLSAQDFSAFAAWSTALALLASGLLLPVETELTRVLAKSDAFPEQVQQRAFEAAREAGMMVLIISAGLLAAAGKLVPDLFGGSWVLLALLAGGVAVMGLLHLTYGLANGTGRFGVTGGALVALSVFVAIGSALLGLGQMSSAAGFAAVLPVSGVVVALVVWSRWLRSDVERPVRARGSTPDWPRPSFMVSVGAATALQLLIQSPVLLAQLFDSDGTSAAGSVLAILAVARIPIVLVIPLQSVVLHDLMKVRGSTIGSELVLRRAGRHLLVASSLSAAFVAGAAVFGPALVAMIFGNRLRPAATEMIAFSLASSLLAIGTIGAQVLFSANRGGLAAIGWGLGIPGIVLGASLASSAAAAAQWSAVAGASCAALAMLLLAVVVERPPGPSRPTPAIRSGGSRAR